MNFDRGEFNPEVKTGEPIVAMLRISQRKLDGVKKRFVYEGLEISLGGLQYSVCGLDEKAAECLPAAA